MNFAIPAAVYRSAQGPRLESAPRSAVWLGVPQRVLFECFLSLFEPHKRQKVPARAPGHSCKWRPGSQHELFEFSSYNIRERSFSARSVSARSFFAPPPFTDVRAFGSWMSAPKCSFFQGFESCPRFLTLFFRS